MAPDLSPLTKDLLFNPGATSILARIEALSSSEIAQGGFKEFFREGRKKWGCFKHFKNILLQYLSRDHISKKK